MKNSTYTPEIYRNQSRNGIWKKWGMVNKDGSHFTHRDYNAAFLVQAGKCYLCDRHQSEFKQRLAADHNHATGQFRGLLCLHCNWRVGILEDKEFCARATIYIAR